MGSRQSRVVLIGVIWLAWPGISLSDEKPQATISMQEATRIVLDAVSERNHPRNCIGDRKGQPRLPG